MFIFIHIFPSSPHACTCDIQPARRVSFFSLFPNHMINHLITMYQPHDFTITNPIAPSQSVPLLVSMFALYWKPNMVCVQCIFSIYSRPPSLRILQPKVLEFSSGMSPLIISPFPLPYAYAPLCRFSLLIYALYLLGVFLSSFLMQLYMEPSIREPIDISGPPGNIFIFAPQLDASNMSIPLPSLIAVFVNFHVCPLLETKHGLCMVHL